MLENKWLTTEQVVSKRCHIVSGDFCALILVHITFAQVQLTHPMYLEAPPNHNFELVAVLNSNGSGIAILP